MTAKASAKDRALGLLEPLQVYLPGNYGIADMGELMPDFITPLVHTDVRTLMAVLFWTNLVTALVNITYWFSIRTERKFAILKLFTLSKVFQLLTFALLLARGTMPDFLTQYVANSLFFVAMYAEALSVYKAMELDIPRVPRILGIILVLGLIAYNLGAYYYPDPASYVVAACIPVLFLASVPTFLLLFSRGRSGFHRVLGFFYFLFCLMQILRIRSVMTVEGLTTFSNHPVQSLSFISLIMLNTLSSSILFISLKERLFKTQQLRQQELEEAAQAALEADRRKTNFLAVASHEIRAPLNNVLGLAELAIADSGITVKAKERLERITVNVRGLLQIITDILDVSRIEAGKMELEKVPFDLQEIFASCRLVVEPKARNKRLDLHFFAEPLPGRRLLGDPVRLRQVLLNLLSNAVKFTRTGSITLESRVVDEFPGGAAISFEVKDTGIGMTRVQESGAFHAFDRDVAGAVNRIGGSGLGLTIAKDFVELMGGGLKLSSGPGVGTTFTFVLNFETVADSEESAGATASSGTALSPEAASTLRGDVLVCGGDRADQEAAHNQLTHFGLKMAIAGNGQIGVAMARERLDAGRPYDLIFLNVRMPVMDGAEAAKALGDMGYPCPIVAFGAGITAVERQVCKEAGIEDFLPQPITDMGLWTCMRRFLSLDNGSGGTMSGEEAELYARFTKRGTVDMEAGLRNAAGDPDLYTRLCRNFMCEKRDAFENVFRAFDRGDMDAAIFQVHSLKDVAATIGATNLASASLSLELFLREGEHDPERGDMLMEAVRTHLKATLEDLDSWQGRVE